MVTDMTGNYILSAMMGAGQKEADNSFTGTLMGSVGTNEGNKETGLFGFH
jgi:hypothetical protein